MDTKLKSSHRLGILIIILALLLASAGTIGLYPYMKTKAESYHNRRSVRQVEESSNFGNLATQVMNFSYEIWHHSCRGWRKRSASSSRKTKPRYR